MKRYGYLLLVAVVGISARGLHVSIGPAGLHGLRSFGRRGHGRDRRQHGRHPGPAPLIGAAVGAWSAASSGTVWTRPRRRS